MPGQGQSAFYSSEMCACQTIATNADNYVALFKDGSKTKDKGDVAPLESSSSFATFVSQPDLTVSKFSKSTQRIPLLNLTIYDFLSSYLI